MNMTRRQRLVSSTAVLFGWIFAAAAAAQSPASDAGRLNVFLAGPDAAFYAAEIPFAAVVPSKDEADIVVEIAPGPAAEGPAVRLSFSGQGRFQGKRDALTYRPAAGEDEEAVRKGVSRLLKLGLLRYCAETPAAERIDVVFQDQVKPTSVADPWNFWVFSLSANGFLSGEQVYRSQSWNFSAAANRVTPDWKIRMGVRLGLSKNAYDYEGYTYESETRSQSASALIVRSLGGHWSAGAAVSAGASTYGNFDLSLSVRPAVEFDVFPYSESTRMLLCFLYTLGPEYNRYTEETIFNTKRELLWAQSLSAALDLKRPWGTMSVSLSGSHYLHDVSKNKLELDANISWRILKGLNFNINGGGARIRDQLSLPKGGASYEEVLLRQRELATGYNYYFSVGLSYTFGSVLSNIVNPRFGSGSGTSISISM